MTDINSETKVTKPEVKIKTKHKNTYVNTRMLVIGGLLSALGLLIATVIPKIHIVPNVMTVTIGSHIAVILAMFINPFLAATVAIATAIGFWITAAPVVAMRAFSHIIFAVLGSLVAKKMLETKKRMILFNIVTAFLHGLAEALVVYACMFLFKESFENLTMNIWYYLAVIVGLITVAHSILDFTLAYIVYQPLKRYKLL